MQLDDGQFRVPNRPTGPRDKVLGDGRFSFRQVADVRPGKHRIEIDNRMGERGRFWMIQYPPAFEPHRVEYEPFLVRQEAAADSNVSSNSTRRSS